MIVVTTTPASLTRVRGDHILYGGDAVIPKPFDGDHFLATIRRLIGPAR